jgi:hypothetical protein
MQPVLVMVRDLYVFPQQLIQVSKELLLVMLQEAVDLAALAPSFRIIALRIIIITIIM